MILRGRAESTYQVFFLDCSVLHKRGSLVWLSFVSGLIVRQYVVRRHISGELDKLQPSGVTFPQESVHQKLFKSVHV